MQKQFLCFFFSSVLFFGSWAAESALASDALDEKTYALQARKYNLKHELHVGGAWLPLDAFEKSYAAKLSYTYHINRAWAIEAPSVVLIQNYDTGLQEDLQRLFGVEATDRNSKQMILTGGLTFKPAYKKMILFNNKILHGETFFHLGGGLFFYEDNFKPTADIALGLRVFLSEKTSLRFELRDYLIFSDLRPDQEIMISMGVGFNFGA